MPPLVGNPISVSIQSTLFAHRGRLVSAESALGTAVYAAAFLRPRHIVLEAALLSDPPVFRLILLHELFHFVWPCLGNPARKTFSALLDIERRGGARGELGESSAVRKQLFHANESDSSWRDYVCESFCDTASWLYSGVPESSLFTLRRRWTGPRQSWFEAMAADRPWKC